MLRLRSPADRARARAPVRARAAPSELERTQAIAERWAAQAEHPYEPRTLDALLRGARPRDRRRAAGGDRAARSACSCCSILAHLGPPGPLPRAAGRPRGPDVHDVQAAHAQRATPRPGSAPTRRPRSTSGRATSSRASGGWLRTVAPRRAAAAVERRAGRHVARRAAADPPGVLRAALRGDPAVLAAARRPPRAHRVRPAADGARHVVVGEARPRPRVARRPLRRALPEPRWSRRRGACCSAARATSRRCAATGRRSRDVRHLRARSRSTAGRPTTARSAPWRARSRTAGPDSEGVFVDGPVGAGRAAAVDHRPRARRPADAQRGRQRRGRPERRALRAPAAAGRPRARAGTGSARTATPRCCRTSTRSAGPTSPPGCAGCSRSRSGTRASGGSARPRPVRDQAAVLDGRGRRARRSRRS